MDHVKVCKASEATCRAHAACASAAVCVSQACGVQQCGSHFDAYKRCCSLWDVKHPLNS